MGTRRVVVTAILWMASLCAQAEGSPEKGILVWPFVKDAFLPSANGGIERLVLFDVDSPVEGVHLHIEAVDVPTSTNAAANDRSFVFSRPLKLGRQSIPVWLPLHAGRAFRVRVESLFEQHLLPQELFRDAPRALFRLRATEPVHPTDAGLGMAPAWEVPMRPGSDVELEVSRLHAPTTSSWVRVLLVDKQTGKSQAVWDAPRLMDPARSATVKERIDLPELKPGAHELRISLMNEGQAHVEESFLLNSVEASPPTVFGARETDLTYSGPVFTNWDESISYEQAWEGFSAHDVVIDFPDQPYRYVFWKGASYVPLWMFDRTFATYEWMETATDDPSFVDCIEPLQDRRCEYSRVKLLSTSAARARVKWNYAETDFNVRIVRDEHAEEVYTMYPDGIGVYRSAYQPRTISRCSESTLSASRDRAGASNRCGARHGAGVGGAHAAGLRCGA